MARYSLLLLALVTACERSDTVVDGGNLCIADDDRNSLRPGTATIEVGDPIPLVVQAGFGCSTEVVSTECMVDIVGDEAIISSVMEVTTPGRLPWQGQDMCLALGSALCAMPPSTEGITRIRYGVNSMDITVPSEVARCISAFTDEPLR